MDNLITIQDFFIVPATLLGSYLLATRIKNKNIATQPCYQYFRWGLLAKIFSGIAFSLIYLFYYGGGDTTYYFEGSMSISKMLFKDIPTFFKLIVGDHSAEVYSMFDRNTGYPGYFKDPNSFSVSRFNILFYWLGMGSYLGNTIIMNLFLYFGVWRFYKMLVTLFPGNEKWLALGVFFVPSVAFWSSGILKDGWTITAVMVIFTNIYYLFIAPKNRIQNILMLIFWSYIAFSIRPYIFYVTIGSALVWVGFATLHSIKSRFIHTVALPFIMLLTWFVGVLIMAQFSAKAGNRYQSIDSMLETAWIIQDDLKKDYYGGNSFDIGEFEPTIGGVIKKAPKAIIAGIFRPFIWEGNGLLMFLSGFENLLLLLAVIYILFRFNPWLFLKKIYQQPFLMALFVFSITFAFSVGLTTANFGALVRYAIPVKLVLVILLTIIFVQNRTTNSPKNAQTIAHF